MKKLTLSVLSILAISSSASAFAAETYNFDANHTNITWHANHFGFSNPSGKFAESNGTLVLDEQKPENSTVSIKIKTGSLITGIAKFDEHLKSPDFLDSAKFPIATFTSNKVELAPDNKKAKVTGTLNLHGVDKPVTLDVTLNKLGENPINKKKTAGFSATTTIKRSDFGISMYVPNVSDEVKIDIEAEANLADGKPAEEPAKAEAKPANGQ